MKYYLATKRDKVLMDNKILMNLENVMLNEGNQSQKIHIFMIAFIENVSNSQIYRQKID